MLTELENINLSFKYPEEEDRKCFSGKIPSFFPPFFLCVAFMGLPGQSADNIVTLAVRTLLWSTIFSVLPDLTPQFCLRRSRIVRFLNLVTLRMALTSVPVPSGIEQVS